MRILYLRRIIYSSNESVSKKTGITRYEVLHFQKKFLTLLLILLFSACGPKKEKENLASDPTLISQVEWILGEWSNQTKEGTIGENWRKVNDSLYQGEGYGLHEKDTIFKESLSILVHEGELYYVPVVSGQNDGQPVWFKITDIHENSFTSTNRNHDFPQIIRYTLESPSILLAVLEGPLGGKETFREFRYRKNTLRLMP